VPLDTVQPLLAARQGGAGIRLAPAPREGRAFGPVSRRQEASSAFWKAQRLARYGRFALSDAAVREVLAIDPDNLGALLTLGQVLALEGTDEGRRMMRHAVEIYPDHPEVLHWYAHSIWSQSWRQSEALLRAIQPFLPHDGDLLYDLACTSSLGGDLDEAERFLRAALDAGYRPWDHIDSDPDLRSLRESGRFARVLRDYR
jgi:hypothetical protein